MRKNTVNATYDEKFVKTTLLYANSSKVLFYDPETKTDKVLKDELEEAFKKGVTISYNKSLYKPVICTTDGLVSIETSGAVTAITFTGSDADA